MAHLTVDIGGRPGVDCRGFCSYCYFKKIPENEAPEPFGCRYCLPMIKGCDYCTNGVRERYESFKSLREVADTVLGDLQFIDGDLERVTISGGGDPSCYPDLRDLFEMLGSMQVPLHIGYTSGKGFDDPEFGKFLIENGLTEISFTIFSADPELRREWMGDKTPEASLKVLEDLCAEIDVYAAVLVLPGVNDGEKLEETCAWLDERGAKGLILMRFANRTDQGLILGNAPIIPNQQLQTVSEFRDLVTRLNEKYNMKINGTPLWDPEIGSPFAIANEPDLLEKLPKVTSRVTCLSGSIAARPVQQILDARGNRTRVVNTSKEIACLMTADDLRELDPDTLEDTIIIPGRSFIHEREAQEILTGNGNPKTIIRGPELLTADAEMSMGMSRNEVLQIELDGFAELIRLINRHGVPYQ